MELDSHSIATTLQVLRDPAGIPSHPIVFQVLMIATWVFHILFVNIALGTAGLSLYAFAKRQTPHWERLSIGMTKAAKVSVSMLIVLGVAPLLFTQVIYDPQWYSSNILSGAWAIGFIFTLILGYSSWFTFYFKNHQGASDTVVWWGIIGLAFFLLDGFIMHALSYQALLPDQWMSWYAPNGKVDMSGTHIHAWQAGRFLFFIAMSVTVLGAFLKAYVNYYRVREDYEADYLTFVNRLGTKIILVGVVAQIVTFTWWLADLPASFHAFSSPLALAIFAILILLGGVSLRQQKEPHVTSYQALAVTVVMAALIATFRELLRMQYMLPYGYDIETYKVMEDIPSTALFFLTFIGVGGLVGGFFLTAIYKAGRTQGVYEASPTVNKLANSAIGIMIAWVGIFFMVGIFTWVSNTL